MYPKAFIDYLVYFHSFRDYFECHEVLEEYWKEKDKKERLWVGLIQVAVAMYHHRRNNFLGAKKQLDQAIEIIETNKEKLNSLGIDSAELLNILMNRKEAIINQVAYSPIHFPIKDERVVKACIKNSQNKGCSWGNKSVNVPYEIIHKHKLRDRTQIIEERLINLRKKRKNK